MSASGTTRVRRRLTFQLTPLLDLLLIVIFAQYMEVQQRSEAARGELARQHADLAAARDTYLERIGSLQRQHEAIADRWAETLDLPRSLARELATIEQQDRPAQAERLRAAISHLNQYVAARGDELYQFMVEFDAMQKHVSLWELHLLANGQAELRDGARSQVVSFATPTEFTQHLLGASKLLDEPKTLVIILLTYGDTQAGFRRIAADSMPALTNALRADSGGTRWYDYSLLGFRPQRATVSDSTRDSR